MVELFLLLTLALPLATLTTGLFFVLRETLPKKVTAVVPIVAASGLLVFYEMSMSPSSVGADAFLNLVGLMIYPFLSIVTFPLFERHISLFKHEYVVFITAFFTFAILFIIFAPRGIVVPVERSVLGKIADGSLQAVKVLATSSILYIGFVFLDASLKEGIEYE